MRWKHSFLHFCKRDSTLESELLLSLLMMTYKPKWQNDVNSAGKKCEEEEKKIMQILCLKWESIENIVVWLYISIQEFCLRMHMQNCDKLENLNVKKISQIEGNGSDNFFKCTFLIACKEKFIFGFSCYLDCSFIRLKCYFFLLNLLILFIFLFFLLLLLILILFHTYTHI